MTKCKQKFVSFFVILNKFTVSKGNTHCSGSGHFQKSHPDPVKAGPEVQCKTEKKPSRRQVFIPAPMLPDHTKAFLEDLEQDKNSKVASIPYYLLKVTHKYEILTEKTDDRI